MRMLTTLFLFTGIYNFYYKYYIQVCNTVWDSAPDLDVNTEVTTV